MLKNQASENNISLPPIDKDMSLPQWLWAETKYHLFPWGSGFLTQKPAIIAASIGLAIAVTVAWILVATGRVAPLVVIIWWSGWSVYESFTRTRCKPWIKEGTWWGRQYRHASAADIIAYVATKNLLIGALLFWMLYLLGMLPSPGN